MSTLMVDKHKLHVEQEFSNAEEGSVLWDCSRSLLACLARSSAVDGQRVLEIGAGTGVVGIGLARLGAKSVVITDKLSQLPLMKRNLEHNQPTGGDDVGRCSQVEVLPLAWGNDRWRSESPKLATANAFDLIVCCDCVYPSVSSAPLADLLLELLELNPRATVLLAAEYRSPPESAPEGVDHVQAFFRRMREDCLLEQLGEHELAPEWRCEEISIWRMRVRSG